MPSAVTIYIVHHPQSDFTRSVSQNLLRWFRLSDATGAQSDAGLPVWYRREITPAGPAAVSKNLRGRSAAVTSFSIQPAIDWDAAVLNVVMILVDQHLVSSIEWCSAIEQLMRESADRKGSILVLPVALHDSFYRMTGLYEAFNPIRLLDAGTAEAAAITLRRLASEAITRRLRRKSRNEEPEKLEVFLSHAKADGREIAERIRDSLGRYGQLDAWFDANELAVGDKWQKKILNAAGNDTAAMISIVTDHYSSRPWCRMEVVAARTPQPVDRRTRCIWKLQPAVAVHLPGTRWSRTMQALAGLPRIGWQSQQPDVCIADIVDRLMLETLLGYAHRQVAKDLKKQEDKAGAASASSTLYVTWTPCPWTLAVLRNTIHDTDGKDRLDQISRIVYPGYDLRTAEIKELQAVLETFGSQTKLISFEEAFQSIPRTAARSGPPAVRQTARSFRIAVSGIGDDRELQSHGLGTEHLEELLTRLTIALLGQNCQLILGGTLANIDRAATSRLLEIAQTWMPEKTLKSISLANPDSWPLQNYLQWPDCEQLTPEHHASLAGICRLQAVYPPGLPTASVIRKLDDTSQLRYGADSTRILRTRTTELADLRVIFGGRQKSTRGWMPGALEEAGLSIQRQQPLLILGGFGGAAADVAEFLSSSTAPLPESLQYSSDWILRKAADMPPAGLEAIAGFHTNMLEALHSWRTLLHAGHDSNQPIHKIPRGIVMDCLKESNIRKAVGLVVEGLSHLAANSGRN